MINLDPERVTRTLGVIWNASEDILTFEVSSEPIEGLLIKRKILSRISQLGLASPVVVAAKITLQELWKLSLDWDDWVSENLKKAYVEWVAD